MSISAPTKEELIFSNLKQAVQAQAVPDGEVHRLLDRAEENGSQHIFYYRPRTKGKANIYRDGLKVAKSLWGESWRQTMNFPRLDLVPEEVIWADFTIGKYHKKQFDWTAKLYGHEVHYRYTGNTEVRDGYLYREYKVEEERTVSLVRYNWGDRSKTNDLLEIRVPRASSRKLIESRLNRVWTELGSGLGSSDLQSFSKDDFSEWDLGAARLRLLREQANRRSLYRLGDAQLLDSAAGTAQFSPHTEDENLFTALEREEAINAFLNHHGECPHLAVTWLPGGAEQLKNRGVFSRPVRTVIGDREANELVVVPNTEPEVVDHVTSHLRLFDR